MSNRVRRLLIAASASIICFVGLTYWYSGQGRAISQSEIEAYMTQIAAQPHNPELRHDLPALRRFLEEDDGLPFYTVNLYRFFDRAQYPANSGFTGTGREAFDRFSKVTVRLLAARASHPVYGSNWMSDDDQKWHRIVIVRYRSRRDIVDVFASEEFAEASLHKTASLAENGRMLTHAIHIPDGRIVFLLLALVVGSVTYGVSAWSRRTP